MQQAEQQADVHAVAEVAGRLKESVGRVVVGKQDAVDLLLAAHVAP